MTGHQPGGLTKAHFSRRPMLGSWLQIAFTRAFFCLTNNSSGSTEFGFHVRSIISLLSANNVKPPGNGSSTAAAEDLLAGMLDIIDVTGVSVGALRLRWWHLGNTDGTWTTTTELERLRRCSCGGFQTTTSELGQQQRHSGDDNGNIVQAKAVVTVLQHHVDVGIPTRHQQRRLDGNTTIWTATATSTETS